MLVNAVTPDGGAVKGEGDSDDKGVASHPRCVVVADERSNLSFVQSSVDLDTGAAVQPKLYNGYTQVFVKEDANVTHSYIDESGGMPTPGVELKEKDLEEGAPLPRTVEANRPELKDSHLEAVDVHLVGERALYDGVIMSIGGSGRVRISHYVSLLKPEATAKVNGFSLSGGAQVTECKTNIHHIAQATNSEQLQKNMVGGRATGSFRGRIRVEQSAQQTDSQQLSRSVLLNDVCKTWTVPSLEIIADDVVCTHGATVSDLSEEELFYLRSRGLDQSAARNMLMYAFAGEACAEIDKTILGETGSKKGLQARLLRRLDNVVPEGDRALQGEFQSV
uniref:SUF system FeS cluster assembly SufBD core domain-containing protein n=1 Tax=Craspedostauros australis TaxID=1486917 RepID=A0A7R9WNL7_9STRA